MSADSSTPSIHHAASAGAAAVARPGRALRSGVFFVTFLLFAVLYGVVQRFIVWPLALLLPRKRRAIVAWWFRSIADITIWITRHVGGVSISVDGALPPESAVVVMNHQSLLDVPIACSLVRGPQVVIPTRDRYKYGVPGVSPIGRLGRFPYLSQRRRASRDEVENLKRVAGELARGEITLVIFPEGHRTKDGSLGRFMRSGLRLILTEAHRPVWCVVTDGMWHARTLKESIFSFAGADVKVTFLGPFPAPDVAGVDEFIDILHGRMSQALDRLRDVPSPPPVRADAPVAAR
jgi:1-acyl-sn-glycerol-3-phosphate acyltransferase